jgi:hypothetical protein
MGCDNNASLTNHQRSTLVGLLLVFYATLFVHGKPFQPSVV